MINDSLDMKTPPHNLEAGQAILGAILVDNESILKAMDKLQPQDFYREGHQRIYSAMLDLFELGEAIDVITLTNRLRKRGELDTVGGQSYIMELAETVPTAANIAYHSRIVKGKATQRRLIAWAYTVINEAGGEPESLEAFLQKKGREFLTISETVTERHSPHVADIINELRALRAKEQAGELTHIPMDYKFNTVIPGHYPGHLHIIGGYTSQGKSTLLAQIVVDACKEGARVLIFSTEDSRREKVFKLIANLSGVSQRRLIEGAIEGSENRVEAAEKQIKEWGPIIYDDVYSIPEMRLKARKHALQGGLDIIALDYIQAIRGEGSEYERMTAAIVELQALAKELDVTVIVLSQVNNEAMRDETGLIGLKGSGALAAAPDFILWLKRVKGSETDLDCEVKKNRPFGTTGLIKMKFADNWTRIDRR